VDSGSDKIGIVVLSRDPLRDPTRLLVRRVYAYVAYRIGDGPDAEDVTSETFERALRYRDSYDASKGEVASWLIGIARQCINDAAHRRIPEPIGVGRDETAPGQLEDDALRRLMLADALRTLDRRDQDLIALRYGSDLPARQIAEIVGMSTNAVEVALHRALGRLRARLEGESALETLESQLSSDLHVPRRAPQP